MASPQMRPNKLFKAPASVWCKYKWTLFTWLIILICYKGIASTLSLAQLYYQRRQRFYEHWKELHDIRLLRIISNTLNPSDKVGKSILGQMHHTTVALSMIIPLFELGEPKEEGFLQVFRNSLCWCRPIREYCSLIEADIWRSLAKYICDLQL